MAKYEKENYPILDRSNEDFECREREITHPYTTITVNKGCDKGMILKVVKITHCVQFCKNFAFDNGYKIFVEVVKPADRDYKKGDKYHLNTMGEDAESYLKEKYTIN